MAKHRKTRQEQVQTSATALTYDLVRFLKLPLIGRIRTLCPARKPSPLLSGLSSRESLTNRNKDAKQMKAKQFAGAASDVSSHWREVDWRTVTGEVRQLQVRIVKPVGNG